MIADFFALINKREILLEVGSTVGLLSGASCRHWPHLCPRESIYPFLKKARPEEKVYDYNVGVGYASYLTIGNGRREELF